MSECEIRAHAHTRRSSKGQAYRGNHRAAVLQEEERDMNGIVEGVAGNAIWSGMTAFGRKLVGNQIQITYPRSQELLSGGEQLSGSHIAFPVRGTLKRIPEDHHIWVLTQDDSTGFVWPQGFFPVLHDPQQGTWLGKINGSGKKQVRIVAVVAPPTSHDFFNYFQKLGRLRNYQFEPLLRVPPECRNRASVQALIPEIKPLL